MRPYSTIKLFDEGKGVLHIDHYSLVFVFSEVLLYEYFYCIYIRAKKPLFYMQIPLDPK